MHIHSVASLGTSCGTKGKESTCQCQRWVQIRCLNWEDPLEKKVATHCSILARRIPWTEGSGNLQSLRSQVLDTIYCINHHYHAFLILLFKFNEIFSTGANSHLLPYSRILPKFVITVSFCLQCITQSDHCVSDCSFTCSPNTEIQALPTIILSVPESGKLD